jgi:hypothetical protein
MKPRMDYEKAAPEVRKIMLDFYARVADLGLDQQLLMLYLRASQLNGCAY